MMLHPLIVACVPVVLVSPTANSCPPVVLASALHKVRDHAQWCLGTRSGQLRLAAAKNEYESFQVVVNQPNATVLGIKMLFVGNSSGAAKLNGYNSVLVHRAVNIDIKKPSDCDGDTGRWPDALIPERDPWFREARSVFPTTVANQNALFWVDLFLHPEVPAGNYTASVTVELAGGHTGDAHSITTQLSLRVFDFKLESTSRKYKSSYGLSWEGVLMAAYGKEWRQHIEDAANMSQRYVELGLMHRLSFSHGGIPDPSLRSPPIDWLEFDKRWGAYVKGGKDMPYGLKGASFTSVEAPASPVLNAEFHAKALEQGWLDKLVTKVCDEPQSADAWAICGSACEQVHAASPAARCEVTSTLSQFRTVSNNTMNVSDVGVFTALINLVENSPEHCPGYPSWAFRNTRVDYDTWQAAGANREFWMYQSCMSEGCSAGINKSSGCQGLPCDAGWPSLMIDAPAIMNRIFPVLGYYYNASGELYWHTNYADTCTRENVIGNCPVDELPTGAYGMDPWKNQLIMGGNGDGQLTYPGRTEVIGGSSFVPIASIRLKQLRDGMEDNQYFHLLEAQYGRGLAMQKLRVVVRNAFIYTRDAELWADLREEIGSMIENGLKSVLYV